MNRIVTRGLGYQSKVVARGFGGDITIKIREVMRLCSKLAREMLLVSEWRKIY